MTNPDLSGLMKLLPLSYEDGPDYCTVKDAEGDSFALTVYPEIMKEMESALRRLASSDSGVKVRELEWRDHRPDSFPEPAWSAQTSFGFYNIEEVSASDSPAYVVRLHAHHFVADKDSLDEAKAAAQADYEARIKSALVEVPAVKGEPEPVAHRKMTREEYNALNLKGWHAVRHDEECDGVTEVSYTAPADAGMREALEQIRTVCDEPFSYGRSHIANKIAAIVDAALTAPGATTKSDGGEQPNATTIAAIEELKRGGGEIGSGYGEYTPVTVRGSTSDPSSTRSEVTAELRTGVLSAIRSIYGIGFGTFAGVYQNDSIECAVDKIVALLDQFEIRRK